MEVPFYAVQPRETCLHGYGVSDTGTLRAFM